MNPNKAKSFPAATVPAVAKLGHRRSGKRGIRSEERRNARRAHASKQQCRQWRSRGVVGLPHPTRRKKEGKNLGRKHLEELWRVYIVRSFLPNGVLYVVRSFLPNGVFLPCDHGLDF